MATRPSGLLRPVARKLVVSLSSTTCTSKPWTLRSASCPPFRRPTRSRPSVLARVSSLTRRVVTTSLPLAALLLPPRLLLLQLLPVRLLPAALAARPRLARTPRPHPREKAPVFRCVLFPAHSLRLVWRVQPLSSLPNLSHPFREFILYQVITTPTLLFELPFFFYYILSSGTSLVYLHHSLQPGITHLYD